MEADLSNYFATSEFLQYIYSVLVAKNHQKIRSGCLVHEFFFTDIFSDINHSYRAALLKKNYSWLLPFHMAVASHCYYEKMHRTLRTAGVSYLLKYFYYFSAAQLNNIESENEVLFRNFHAKRVIMEIAMMKISSRLNNNYFPLTLSWRRLISYRNQICSANQWTGFYMISASVMKGLNESASL